MSAIRYHHTIMAKRMDPHDLIGLLRAAFRDSGMSMKALADAAGTPYANVHAFIVGGGDIRLATAGKLCKVLGLTLKPTHGRKG